MSVHYPYSALFSKEKPKLAQKKKRIEGQIPLSGGFNKESSKFSHKSSRLLQFSPPWLSYFLVHILIRPFSRGFSTLSSSSNRNGCSTTCVSAPCLIYGPWQEMSQLCNGRCESAWNFLWRVQMYKTEEVFLRRVERFFSFSQRWKIEQEKGINLDDIIPSFASAACFIHRKSRTIIRVRKIK